MKDKSENPPEYDIPLDHVHSVAGWVEALELAIRKRDEWDRSVKQIQGFLEEELRKSVSPTEHPHDVRGKRRVYATVEGKRLFYLTDYEQAQFQMDKFRSNHEDLHEQFTTKVPRKKFGIVDKR